MKKILGIAFFLVLTSCNQPRDKGSNGPKEQDLQLHEEFRKVGFYLKNPPDSICVHTADFQSLFSDSAGGMKPVIPEPWFINRVNDEPENEIFTRQRGGEACTPGVFFKFNERCMAIVRVSLCTEPCDIGTYLLSLDSTGRILSSLRISKGGNEDIQIETIINDSSITRSTIEIRQADRFSGKMKVKGRVRVERFELTRSGRFILTAVTESAPREFQYNRRSHHLE